MPPSFSAEHACVGAVLAWARPLIGLPHARLLLCHVLDCPPPFVIAHPEHALTLAQQATFKAVVQRAVAGEPVAYLLGQREFYGRLFAVGPGVLIPRPETEHLIDEALAQLKDHPAPCVLDMGTGSGCVAITLALEWQKQGKRARVWASERAGEALAFARRNADALHAAVHFCQGDWFEALAHAHEKARGGEKPEPPARFDLIVSNPPYIAETDPHLGQGDLRFEPQTALASGPQGLDALTHLIDHAPAYLVAGGGLLLEHGFDQAAPVREHLKARGFDAVFSRQDLAGIERITGGFAV